MHPVMSSVMYTCREFHWSAVLERHYYWEIMQQLIIVMVSSTLLIEIVA